MVRATGTRRMRRRPAAGASSSRNVEATVEGLVFVFFFFLCVKILHF